MKKRFLAMFLTLVMCLAMIPTAALAADSDFTIENGELTKYNGSGGNVTIPDGVTSIGLGAFSGCTGLTSVTIPNSVTKIGDSAFIYCSALTSVTIPNSVTSIGGYAFRDCTGLTSVTIPSNVTEIGESAFEGTPWLKNLGDFAIVNGILLNYQGDDSMVMIPEGVTKIVGAFVNCTGLTSVTIPDSVTSIGREAFNCCTGLASVTIPNSVTSIEDAAFSNCTGLTSVTIPNSVTSIGIAAFSNCTGLTSVIIPSSVTELGAGVFSHCTGLTSVTIPSSVTKIESGTFGLCTELKDVYYSGTEAQWEAISISSDTLYLGGNVHVDGNLALRTATIHYNSTMPEQPTQPVSTNAQPTNDKLSVDGKDATPAAYKIGGANYFMLRDVAMLLNGTKAQFEISYDNDKKAINITTGKAYTPQGYELKTTPQPNATAETSSDAVYINGEKVELTAYKIGGANFYGIRDLGRALGFNVGWKQGTGMYIESNKPYSDAD